jgi:hypothetical protein
MNPHCRIRSVRPRDGSAHIRLLIKPSLVQVPLVTKAQEITAAFEEPIEGYVIFAWTRAETHSGYLVPHGGRFHPNQMPTIVAEQLRSDMIGWPDTMSLLRQLGLVRPDPPKGA